MCVRLTVRNKHILSKATPVKTIEGGIELTQKPWQRHGPCTTAVKADRMLSPHCSATQNGFGWTSSPFPFAITHQLLLRSIYHPLLIENTHPLWLKKATHIKTEGHTIPESWLAVRKRALEHALVKGILDLSYRACLITLPSPVFKVSLVLCLHPANYSSLKCRY